MRGLTFTRRLVEREPDRKNFVAPECQWVEHSYGRLVHWGGLLRDRAACLDVVAARLACVAILSSVEFMVNPSSI